MHSKIKDCPFQDSISADPDGDGLSNLDELIMGTDPLSADTDGDGVTDGEEAEAGADPDDPRDEGRPRSKVANIKLTSQKLIIRTTFCDLLPRGLCLAVGDHSSSESERYVLHVGPISHQSPGFGLVGSGNYNVSGGKYRITVQHVATNLETGVPDYDYTAKVMQVGGASAVTIEDPQGKAKGASGKMDLADNRVVARNFGGARQ